MQFIEFELSDIFHVYNNLFTVFLFRFFFSFFIFQPTNSLLNKLHNKTRSKLLDLENLMEVKISMLLLIYLYLHTPNERLKASFAKYKVFST